jgi:dTDP-glucose 4,6-dehydratase
VRGTGGRLVLTGSAGFLGAHGVRTALAQGREVVGLDALTYAGDQARLGPVPDAPAFRLVRADVADRGAVREVLSRARPDAVVHMAAETHVTRSERQAGLFFRTNVEGTRVMLEESARAGVRRFVHMSTDEVYGPIGSGAFREEDKAPGTGQATSPYARAKSAADDLARSFAGATDMQVVVLRPTNAFGPGQFPEKALARWITRGLTGRPLPIWGDGRYVRQWLHAEDLVAAALLVVDAPAPGPAYNVGPRHDPEVANVDVARRVLSLLDLPEDRLMFTGYDRPDHDRRYAVDPARIEGLGWRAGDLDDQLAATVDWYRRHRRWWSGLLAEAESIYNDRVPAPRRRVPA